MADDIYAIDTNGTARAGDQLHLAASPIRSASDNVGRFDRRGAELAPTTSSLMTLLDEIADEMELLGSVFHLRAELGELADRTFTAPGAIDGVHGRFDELMGELRTSIDDEIGTRPTTFTPTDAWTPAEVSRWWASLSDDERSVLIFTESARVGNTDGIAVEDRYLANRNAIHELLDDGSTDERLAQFVNPVTGRVPHTRQIIVFDPDGDGLIAEVFGDLTTGAALRDLFRAERAGDEAVQCRGAGGGALRTGDQQEA